MAEDSESDAEREPETKSENATPTSRLRSSSSGGVAGLRGLVTLPVVALLVAAVALALSGWMWFHPRSSSSSGASADQSEAFTDIQRADAKTKICEAFRTVEAGVSRNTNLVPEGGDTEVGILATVANWRLSVWDGGQYLLARLEPATPPDLADPIRSLGNVLMDVGAAATAGVPEADPAQAPRIQEVVRLMGVVAPLCQ